MREVRHVRLRAGALVWRLYEDVARPDRWIELWAMESWTDHLREATRLDGGDVAALARAAAMHRGDEPLEVSRYLDADPRRAEELTQQPEPQPPKKDWAPGSVEWQAEQDKMKSGPIPDAPAEEL